MNKFRIVIGSTILLIGVALVSFPFIMEWQTTKKERALKEALSFLQTTDTTSSHNADALQSIDNNIFSEDVLKQVVELEIPALSIKQFVLPEPTPENLKIALTQIKEKQTAGKGNYTIAGHRGFRDGRHFSNLDKLTVGEKILLHENETTYIYKMTESKVIEATYVDILKDHDEKNEITLITCTPSGLKRVAIIGELITKIDKEQDE